MNARFGHPQARRSFVVSRVSRLGARTTTVVRGATVAAVGVLACWWGRTQLGPVEFLAPFLIVAVRTWRALRAVKWRRRARSRHSHLPPGLMAAVDDLAPRFGLRARRISVAVVELGRGPTRDLPLAAAAGWLGGGLLMVDDDLAAKSHNSRPGDRADAEVRAVIGHELAHIYALDSVLGAAVTFAVTATVAFPAATTMVAYQTGGSWPLHAVVLVVFPLVATLAAQFQARRAEYTADRRAAWATGDGDALASALLRDFGDGDRGWRELFDSHPSNRNRAARLRVGAPSQS